MTESYVFQIDEDVECNVRMPSDTVACHIPSQKH
jgi:hypothetical protein